MDKEMQRAASVVHEAALQLTACKCDLLLR